MSKSTALCLALAVPLVAAITASTARADEGARPAAAPPLGAQKLELRPLAGWAAWPGSVTGGLVGGEVGYRPGSTLGFDVDVAAYEPFNAGVTPGSAQRVNESQWSGSFDVSFFPLTGVLGSGSTPNGHEAGVLDAYVLAGLGVVRTRPVSVVDPAHRTFDWNNLAALDVGVGVRVFVSRWLAINVEARDLMYFERNESSAVAGGMVASNADGPNNPSTWYDPSSTFTNAIQARLGVSFFVGP